MAAQSPADVRYTAPVPKGRIVTPLYATYQDFLSIPRRGAHRAFFVMRDPRDLLVSWYFSAGFNHLVDRNGSTRLRHVRSELGTMSQEDGLAWSVEFLAKMGRFAVLESWANAGADQNVMLVRFEDLITPEAFGEFRRIFTFLDIRMPDPILRNLLDAYSFRRLAGRDRDEEDTKSHLRGGGAGSWKRYFTPKVEQCFWERTGDLVYRLGYE